MRIFLCTFAAIFLMSATAAAQGVPTGDFTYKATQSKSQIQKKIKKGIEGAVEDMSFITRPIARGRLEDSNVPVDTVKIKLTPKLVTIQHGDRNPVRSNTEGKPVDWTRKSDGKSFKVSQIVKPQLMIQTFFSEDGKKVLKYKFSENYKKMTMEVILTSPKLGGPLKYEIDFTRN